MAVKMDDLSAKIQVETKQSQKEVKKLSSDLSQLSKETGINEQSLQRMYKELDQIDKINNQVSKSTESYSKNLQGLNKTIDQTDKVIEKTASSFQVMTGVITIAVTAFKAMKAAMGFLTDGEAVGRVTELLDVLKKLAYVKGYERLSKAIETVSASITFLHTQVVKATLSFEKLTKSGDSLLNIAYELKKGFSSVGNAVALTAKVAVGGFVAWKSGLVNLVSEMSVFKSVKEAVFNTETMQNFDKSMKGFKSGQYKKAVLGLGEGFKKTAKDLSLMSQGMILGSENLFALGAGLGSFGMALSKSENGLISFIGKVSMLSAIIAGGLSTVILAVTSAIGIFTLSLGDKLGAAMDKATEKANKASESFRKFSLVVGNVLVEQATKAGDIAMAGLISSLKKYNEEITNAAKATIFGGSQIRDSLKLIIAESRMFGFTAEENIMLFKRATEIAAGTGRDLQDVTLRMIQGLAGSSQGLLALGINLKDTHVEMKNMKEMMGLSLNSFDDMQKAQFRLNDLMGQSKIFLGANASAMDTFTGAAIRADKALSSMQVKIGEQASYILAIKKAYAGVLEDLNKLPDEIFMVVGAFGDLGSILLTVTGYTLKYVSIILILVTTYKALSWAIGSVTGVQVVLNKVFTLAAAKVGVTTVAVTGLNAALINTGRILKGIILRDLKLLAAWFANAAKAALAFSAALLANPITWIVIGVASLVKGLVDLQSEMSILTEFFEIFTGKAEEANKQIEKQTEKLGILAKTWNFLKNSFMLVGALIIQIITMIINGFANLARIIPFMGKSITDSLDGVIYRSQKLISKLSNFREETNKNMFGGVAYAAEKAEKAQKKLQKSFAKTGLTVKKLTDKIKEFRDQTKQINKDIDALQTKSMFNSNAMGQLEAAIALKEKELQIEKDKIQLSGIPSASPTLNPEEVARGMKELNKMKEALKEMQRLQKIEVIDANITKNLKVVERISQEKEKTKDINRQLEAIQYSLTTANLGTFDAIRAQYEWERKILDEQIKQFDLETDIIKANRDNLIALGAEEEKIREINDLLAERGKRRGGMEKKKELIDENEKQAANSAGMEMASGFVQAASSGAEALSKNIISAIGKAYGPIGEFVAGLVNMLSAGYDKMFELGDQLTKIGLEMFTNMNEGILGFVDGVLKAVVDMLGDPEIWVRAISSLTTLMPKIITSVVKAIPKILKAALNINFWMDIMKGAAEAFVLALQEMFSSLWDLITGDLTSSVTTAFTEGVAGASEALMGFTDEMFAVVSDAAGGLGGDGDSNLMSSAEEVGFNIWQAFIDALVDGWHWILGIGEKIWEGLKSMAGNIWDFFLNAGKAVWEGLKGLAGGLGTALKDAFLGAWDSLKGAFGSIGTIIWDAISGIGDKIKGMFSKFFSFDWKGQGTVEKWLGIDIPILKFAEGGPVPHAAGMGPVSRGNSYGNDKVSALLSPGEYVLNREVTGDNSKMSRIMDIVEGREKNFFLGGAVKAVASVATGGASDKIIDGASDMVHSVGEATGVNSALEAAEDTLSGLSDTLKSVWDWISSNVSSLDLTDFVADPMGAVMNVISEGMTNFVKPQMTDIMSSVMGSNKFHTGGLVGNDGMANILGGEFVMNRQAVSQIGAANLGNLNRSALTGGSGNMGNGDIIFQGDINFAVQSNDSLDESFIRSELIPAFMGEIKDKSQRGEFVISSKGIRT